MRQHQLKMSVSGIIILSRVLTSSLLKDESQVAEGYLPCGRRSPGRAWSTAGRLRGARSRYSIRRISSITRNHTLNSSTGTRGSPVDICRVSISHGVRERGELVVSTSQSALWRRRTLLLSKPSHRPWCRVYSSPSPCAPGRLLQLLSLRERERGMCM